MVDARSIYRKVTRKIFDFSSEQQQNILSIVWLYRGETKRFHDLVVNYISKSLDEAMKSIPLAGEYEKVFVSLNKEVEPFLAALLKGGKQTETVKELAKCLKAYKDNCKIFSDLAEEKKVWWKKQKLVLYDLTSTYFEGKTCLLAHRGHNRDKKMENFR
ncbi:hypothetical protein M1N01_01045 [Thermodesulfovibrionales bacterium]|nr:hypothetical protein [Thermodesulfovibrionales bacterium]